MTSLTTCTACGSSCDDIRLGVDSSAAVTEAANACDLGQQWFAESVSDRPTAQIEDKAVSLEVAIDRAAEILSTARLPLITGLRHATIEAQRAAVGLADAIGGCVDWTTAPGDSAATLALQTTGAVTASLGEVAQRADMQIVWGGDIASTHPRHFQRYLLEPTSPWIAGRKDRTLVVIGDANWQTAEAADLVLPVEPDNYFESLTVLRSLVAGLELKPTLVEQLTGVSLTAWQKLVEQMKSARYGAVTHAGQLSKCRESLVALTGLMGDLTATTRWVAVPAGGEGNRTGAANVFAWQTGYPLGVSLACGGPQYGPGEWTTAELLATGEADAALVMADDLAGLSDEAAAHLASIPTIALDWRDTSILQQATVAIQTARPGVECPGTTSRADGVMLPMRAARNTERPTCESVIGSLLELVLD